MALTPDQLAAMKALRKPDYPFPASPAAEADMVMKGGITSGVVYPLAVCHLATKYRFRNLGGTSAGGIAAAFAAAAESNRAGGGFNVLAGLPARLGNDLGKLFVPSKGTRPLFAVLLAGIDREKSGWFKRFAIARAVLRAGWVWFAAVFGASLLLGVWGLLLAAGAPHSGDDWLDVARGLPPVVLLAFLLGAIAAVASLAPLALKTLPRNGYGLCRGSRGADWPAAAPPPESPPEPFADWMHERLNATVGLARGDVLTMKNLWGEAATEEYARLVDEEGVSPAAALRRIEPDVRLEMMTTNVTHCRPARLPFADRTYRFCPVEIRDYLPTPVYEHLVAQGVAQDAEPRECPDHKEQLLPLPPPPELPVVLAVRMTLSFPGLISAVPLFATDFGAAAETPVRCWFSDGGVSSNFPIHFFDSLWPRRPTFGISLGPYHPEHLDSDVYLPASNAPRLPRVRDTRTLPGFVAALMDTLQNWSDEGQGMLPGYRDRIVEVHHRETEGGMNLTMPPDVIESLTRRGYEAGLALDGFDFKRHRWIRYLTAMSRLDDAVRGLADRYDGAVSGLTPPYRAFVRGATGLGYQRSGTWRQKAVARTDALLRFAGWAGSPPGTPPPTDPDFTADAPAPTPDLRITPHF